MVTEPVADTKGRRKFLGKITFGAFSLGIVGQLWTYVRSLVPNVLYEPPIKFKIGHPDQISDGVNFLSERKVYVIKEGNKFNCISAVCTHLGCTVNFVPFDRPEEVKIKGKKVLATHEFRCPCHGSFFRQDGTPYAGPAPSALKWHAIEIAPEDGQLVVDLSTNVDSDHRLIV